MNNEIIEKLNGYIDAHKDEIVDDLAKVVFRWRCC